MSWINWKVGLVFSLILIANFILLFISGIFNGAEALQSIIIYGLITFIVMGYIGNGQLWRHRGFKISLIAIIILLILRLWKEGLFLRLLIFVFPGLIIGKIISTKMKDFLKGILIGITLFIFFYFLLMISWGQWGGGLLEFLTEYVAILLSEKIGINENVAMNISIFIMFLEFAVLVSLSELLYWTGFACLFLIARRTVFLM